MLLKLAGIALAASLVVNAIGGIALKRSYEANGKLEHANKALELKLKEMPNAARERATIERNNRSVPDPELFDSVQ